MGAVSACREELGDRAPAAGSPVGKPAGTQVYNHKKKPDLGALVVCHAHFSRTHASTARRALATPGYPEPGSS